MVERVIGQVIACKKWIDFAYFDCEGFFIGDWIRFTGCEGFFSMRERYYPYLINEFYGLLAKGGDEWVAIIRGISIPVGNELLSHV